MVAATAAFALFVVAHVLERGVGGWIVTHASHEVVEELEEVVKTSVTVNGDFDFLGRQTFNGGFSLGVADFSD
jgi:hypothetical protein